MRSAPLTERLQRLRHRRLDHRRGGARIGRVVTCTCGGTMSGNCATGSRVSEISPAMVMMMADDDRQSRPIDEDRGDHALSSRPAWPPGRRSGYRSRGCRSWGCRSWACRSWGRRASAPATPRHPGAPAGCPRRSPCHPAVRPLRDHRGVGGRLAEHDAARLRLVVGVHHVDVVALLVGQHRAARDAERLDRLDPLQQGGDELAVDQQRGCRPRPAWRRRAAGWGWWRG